MINDDLPDLTELYGEFVSECREIIEKLSKELVALENSPDDKDLINRLFRFAHTLKGNAGFLGIESLTEVFHGMENVLEGLRDGDFPFFPEINDIFFDTIDAASLMLEEFTDGGVMAPGDVSKTLADIEDLLKWLTKEAGDEGGKAEGKKRAYRNTGQTIKEREPSFMRVSKDRLDRMVNLVGDLAAGRTRLLQISGQIQDEALVEAVSYVDTISARLQDEILNVRMVPIKDLFNRFYRFARDTARSLDKDVRLVVEGEETELDKSVMEVLYDPLVHLVRNSIGHGIEGREERRRKGKEEAGTLTLSAWHGHSGICIQVRDDGRGLDIARIRREAVESGVVSAEQERSASDKDAARFIFTAGFSTAEGLNTVSGRGVGLDAVRADIERIGGNIDIDWEMDRGTKITVIAPLTLAIVQLFLVREGGRLFGIPISYIEETIRVPERDLEYIKGQRICILRHKAIPVTSLAEVFKIDKKPAGDGRDRMNNIVVLKMMNMKLGIAADELAGKVETVIKPLGQFIERLASPPEGITGASILGSGEIALVLDMPSVWKTLQKREGSDSVKNPRPGDGDLYD